MMFQDSAVRHSVFALSLLVLWSAGAYAQQRVTVHVHIAESVSEAPLGAVAVDLVRFAGSVVETGVTDSLGNVDFPAVPSDEYLIRAKKLGYKNLESKIEDSSRLELSANLRMDSTSVSVNSSGAAMVSVRTLALPPKAVGEYEKGSYLLRKHRAKDSLEHFDKAIAAAPNFCEAYYLKGMALLQLQARDADAMLFKSIELNPRFMAPYYPLALSLFSERKYQVEQKILEDAMRQEPQSWQWPFEMARSFATGKQWEPAAQYVQMALSRPNAASKVHLLASDIYSNEGSPDRAVAQLEEFLREDPSSPYAKRVNEVLPTLRREASGATQTAKQSEISLDRR